MAFSPTTVLSALQESALAEFTLAEAIPIQRYWLALSGGLDSMVLLHTLAQLRSQLGPQLGVTEIRAIHINHGLSHYARQWAEHCLEVCKTLSVECEVITVDAQAQAGESPEAAARAARYAAFRDRVEEGDCLLSAHHQDDQAETLLLQLLRGAGPKGLAAMALMAPFHRGWYARPLLQVSREELHAYAQEHRLQWVEDESNSDTGFDRNFLRHEIFPRLKKRYPGAAKTISRSARLCAEAAELLRHQAQQDLQQAAISETSVSIPICLQLGKVRCKQLLHHWLHGLALPTPSEAQTEAIWRDVMHAAEDSSPLVQWEGAEVRRYRDALFAMPAMPSFDATQCHDWSLSHTLTLPGLGELQAVQVLGKGVAQDKVQEKKLQVRFRQGGEQLRPVGRRESHSLKHLFQDAGIPPWQRDRIPLLFCADELVAVVGLWLDERFAAAAGETGFVVSLKAAQRPQAGML